MNISTLNENMFVKNHVLYADELKTVVKKINAIIAALDNIDTSSDTDTSDLESRITALDKYMQGKLAEINNSIGGILSTISSLPEGETLTIDKDGLLANFKQQTYDAFLEMNVAKKIIDGNGSERIVPVVNLGAMEEINTEYTNGKLVGVFSALPGVTSMVANFFNEDGTPKYDGAEIMAAINEDGTSDAYISATKIRLLGDTLANKIEALEVNAGSVQAESLLAKAENADYPRVVINGTDGIKLQTSPQGSTAININPDGSGSLANGNISWDLQGNLEIRGTFRIGAKYIEYIYDDSVTATVSFSDTVMNLTTDITVTNTNNFDIYCAVSWYVNGQSMAWDAGNTTDIFKVEANRSRTLPTIATPAADIQGYSGAAHPSIDSEHSGADVISAYHYIER